MIPKIRTQIRTALLTPQSSPATTTIDTEQWQTTLRDHLIAFHEWGDYIADDTRYPSIIARQIFIVPLLVMVVGVGIVAAFPGEDVLTSAVLEGLKGFIIQVLIDGSAAHVVNSVFRDLLVLAFGTPVPPGTPLGVAQQPIAAGANMDGPAGEMASQTLGASSFLWEEVVAINEKSKTLVLPAISLYFAYYLMLTGIHAIRPSERDMAFIKGILAFAIITINLELYGVLLAFIRVVTLLFLGDPVTLATNFLKGTFGMFTAGVAFQAFGGLAIMGALVVILLFLLLIFTIVLTMRIPVILATAALFPWIITGYLFGQAFRPIEAVMNRVFGYVYPMLFVTIPAAAMFWITSIIFSGITIGATTITDPLATALANAFLAFMGIGTLTMGILLVVKSTSAGAKMVSGTKKAVGTAAIIGGVAALGGGGGALFRTGAMTMRYGKGAGLMSGLGEAYRESSSKISEAEAEAQRTGGDVGVDLNSPMDKWASHRHHTKDDLRDEFIAMDMGEYHVSPNPDDAVKVDPNMKAASFKSHPNAAANKTLIDERIRAWKERTKDDPDAPDEPSLQNLVDTFEGDSLGTYLGNVSAVEDPHTGDLPEKEPQARIDMDMSAIHAANQAGIESKPIEALAEEWMGRVQDTYGREDPGYPTVGELTETFGTSVEELYGDVQVVDDHQVGAYQQWRDEFQNTLENDPNGEDLFLETVDREGIEAIPEVKSALGDWVQADEDHRADEATLNDLREFVNGPVLQKGGDPLLDPPEKPPVSYMDAQGIAENPVGSDSVVRPTDKPTEEREQPGAVGFATFGTAYGPEENRLYDTVGPKNGRPGDPTAWLNEDADIDFRAENVLQSERVFEDSMEYLSTQESVREKSFKDAVSEGWAFNSGTEFGYQVMSGMNITDGTVGGYLDTFGGSGLRDFPAKELQDRGFEFGPEAQRHLEENPNIGFGELMHQSEGPTVTGTPTASDATFETYDSQTAQDTHTFDRQTVMPDWKAAVPTSNIPTDYEYYNGQADTRTGDISISGLPTVTLDHTGADHAGIAYTKTGNGTIEAKPVNHTSTDGYNDYVRLLQSVEQQNKTYVDTNVTPTVIKNNWSRIEHPDDPHAPSEVTGTISGNEIRDLLDNVDRGTTVVLDRQTIGRSVDGDIGGQEPPEPDN